MSTTMEPTVQVAPITITESAASEVNAVARLMERILIRAIHEDQPSPDEAAIVRIVGDVWLSNLVAWVTRRASANDVSEHLELAVRLLLR